MGKAIGSALAGYVVMFIAVFVLMTLSWYAVGAEGAFKPGIWEVTPLWNVLLVGAGLLAAWLGGFTTSRLSKDKRAWQILIGIVLVLGIGMALPALTGNTPAAPLPRPEALPMFEAMQNGQQPAWVALLNPIIGAVGAWLGARRRAGS
jgi:hypothetical protein